MNSKNKWYSTNFWIKTALINFCIVGLAGIVLRYKINFSLPVVNHKYLLYGHSYFAFNGWVTMALMACMLHFLEENGIVLKWRRYAAVFWLTLLASYGMFVSFIIQGYGFYSILFSTLAIAASYLFISVFWKDLKKVRDHATAVLWFKTAMILWILSSLGAFGLAYLMVNHIMIQDLYFSAVYFFLHFQYNGWFLFATFGLLFSYLSARGYSEENKECRHFYLLMTVLVLPAYFLSILWLKLPLFLRITGIVSAIGQLVLLYYFILIVHGFSKIAKHPYSAITLWFWRMAYFAFFVKIILQLGSVIPFFSHFAFGLRPVIIGYLHLSFVGIISFFIFGYINQYSKTAHKHLDRTGIVLFVSGFILQELILMMQGFEAMEVRPLPHADVMLFGTALLIGAGLLKITIPVLKKPFVIFRV